MIMISKIQISVKTFAAKMFGIYSDGIDRCFGGRDYIWFWSARKVKKININDLENLIFREQRNCLILFLDFLFWTAH